MSTEVLFTSQLVERQVERLKEAQALEAEARLRWGVLASPYFKARENLHTEERRLVEVVLRLLELKG